MRTLNGQELELFRAGDYGAKGRYTPEDLQQLAASYDPAKHEVPLCIGHPKLNAPAFGWLKSLRAEGNMLFGTPGQVAPAFDAAVQAGLYKKRSVALARHADGRLDLRHVGYLGAALPEVRGLADATFSEEPFEEIEFSEVTQGEVDMADEQKQKEEQRRTITEVLTEFFAGKDRSGKTTEIASPELAALEARLDAKFSAELAAKDAKIVALETSFASQNAGTANTRRMEGVIGTLKANGRWIPAYDRMGVPAIFAALSAAPAQEIEFSEGSTVVKLDPVAAFAKFLGDLKKLVPEGVVFSESGEKRLVPAAPENAGAVDPGSIAFNERVTKFAEEKNVTYIEAYRALQSKGDGPNSGTATAGAV